MSTRGQQRPGQLLGDQLERPEDRRLNKFTRS